VVPSRIVEIDLAARAPSTTTKWLKFQNTITGKVPERDLINLATHAHGLKPVAPRRPHDVAGLAAVARDATGDA
jgi:hypothetical protein